MLDKLERLMLAMSRPYPNGGDVKTFFVFIGLLVEWNRNLYEEWRNDLYL